MSGARILIVVPTIGNRPAYLEKCLTSIAQQSVAADILIVAPITKDIQELAARFNADLLADPGTLAGAINLGVGQATGTHEFVNWIGDDDLLEPRSLATTVEALDRSPDAVVAYGACRYIDQHDNELWVSQAGPWANRILKWGPDLIPQPGMLVRRIAWQQVGGLDESFRFAFDLDLLLKLQAVGRLIDVGAIVSSFRWHADSLTVGDRETSLRESEVARRRALKPTTRKLARLWEGPVRIATRVAAAEMRRRATKASTQGL
jgi:GT2 family glycosyltransferase